MLGMSIRTSRRSARRGRIRPLQTVEIGSDLFSTVWRRSAGVLCEGRSDAYGYQYNFLFGQARMKSSSYDIEGKNHGGVYPR